MVGDDAGKPDLALPVKGGKAERVPDGELDDLAGNATRPVGIREKLVDQSHASKRFASVVISYSVG